MNKFQMSFDEIHGIGRKLRGSRDWVIDMIENILVTAYVRGHKAAMEDIAVDDEELEYLIFDALMNAVNMPVAGQTWKDRVSEYLRTGDTHGIETVLETEYHRVWNTGGWDGIQEYVTRTGNPVGKRWNTMLDPLVRDTHEYLEGDVVPLDARFYTFDGDSARFPGDFANAQNNVNCRCTVTYSQGRL